MDYVSVISKPINSWSLVWIYTIFSLNVPTFMKSYNPRKGHFFFFFTIYDVSVRINQLQMIRMGLYSSELSLQCFLLLNALV